MMQQTMYNDLQLEAAKTLLTHLLSFDHLVINILTISRHSLTSSSLMNLSTTENCQLFTQTAVVTLFMEVTRKLVILEMKKHQLS
jgi:hypothetical protein